MKAFGCARGGEAELFAHAHLQFTYKIRHIRVSGGELLSKTYCLLYIVAYSSHYYYICRVRHIDRRKWFLLVCLLLCYIAVKCIMLYYILISVFIDLCHTVLLKIFRGFAITTQDKNKLFTSVLFAWRACLRAYASFCNIFILI